MWALIGVGRGIAAAPEVKDAGKVFSPDAVAQADARIRELEKVYHKDIIIEYHPTAPVSSWWDKVKKRMLEAKSPESRRRFYADWAKRVARAAGRESIVVLICQEPTPLHVEIAVGAAARKHGGLTDKAVAQLRQELQALFQNGEYDAGLAAAIASIGETLRTNSQSSVPAGTFPWTMVGIIVAALTVLWLGLQTAQGFRTVGANMGAGSYSTGIYLAANANWGTLWRHGRPKPGRHSAPGGVPEATPVDNPEHAAESRPTA
jgi:hypothetical protein